MKPTIKRDEGDRYLLRKQILGIVFVGGEPVRGATLAFCSGYTAGLLTQLSFAQHK